MPTTISTTELRSMRREDLLRESDSLRSEVTRLKLGIELRKEKDTANYRRKKRELARMETVLGEKSAAKTPEKPLKKAKKSSTIQKP